MRSVTRSVGKQIAGDDPFSVGGDAFSSVPEGYEGPCRVTIEGRMGNEFEAVLPSLQEATAVACYAVNWPDGGFSHAQVDPAPGAAVTHGTLVDWICRPF